jgi:hypothetical protein
MDRKNDNRTKHSATRSRYGSIARSPLQALSRNWDFCGRGSACGDRAQAAKARAQPQGPSRCAQGRRSCVRNRAATTHVDQHKPTIFCSAPATAGCGPIMCVPCSTAICAGWHGRGVEPQATCDAARSAHLRRRERGQANRLGLLAASRRPREMDAGLLETKVVELNIVDHASDNTIERVLKKTRSSLISCGNGSSRRKQAAHS